MGNSAGLSAQRKGEQRKPSNSLINDAEPGRGLRQGTQNPDQTRERHAKGPSNTGARQNAKSVDYSGRREEEGDTRL